MLRTRLNIIVLSFLMVVLGACVQSEETNQEKHVERAEVTAIDDLENVEHFQTGALAHILEGELNQKGQAVGYHYDRLPTKKGEIIPGTETEANDYGVYEAQVIVSDVEKTSNSGYSTFFPDDWDTQEVVNKINEAYEHRQFMSGNTYEGLTTEGIIIRMYLNKEEQIISAFPIYE